MTANNTITTDNDQIFANLYALMAQSIIKQKPLLCDYLQECTSDTDGDGIVNTLDLDSDGDGCPDAIEGGGPFTTANLVSSTMAGGSTNITTNLGNNVGSTTATMGVPTTAGTGQTIGYSQNAALNGCLDTDGDGVADIDDLDDDNDGILDAAECTSYTVYLREPVFSGYSPNVPVVITGGNGPISYTWNQTKTPSELFYNGLGWTQVAANVLPDAAGQIKVSIDLTAAVTGSFVGLDGALLYNNATGAYTIIDDSSPATGGFSTVGTWVYTAAAGAAFVGSDQTRADAPFAGKSAAWLFTGLTAPCDTDGDGIANRLDLDSDGDGCPDAIEGGAAFTTANLSSSALAGAVSSASATYGIPVIAGAGQTKGTSQDVAVNVCRDTDGDGILDTDDLDDDNDGILDTVECANATVNSTTVSAANGTASTFTLPATSKGYRFDLTSLDNSFQLTINGQILATQEIQFIPTSSSWTQNIRFADGATYGNQVTNIWQLGTANIATPLIRVVIDETGAVSMFGSKVLNGPLFPLVLTNGAAFQNVKLNATGTNSLTISQSVETVTYINGTFYGVNTATCDTDGDGTPDSLDKDSDNDGCPDAVEGGAIFTIPGGQVNGTTGQLTGAVSTSTATYGVPTIAGTGQTVGFSQFSAINGCTDTDGDGIPDVDDLDDDNDGILDTAECKVYTVYVRNPVFANYSTNVPVVVTSAGLPVTFTWNQLVAPADLTFGGFAWTRVATDLTPDATGKINVSIALNSSVNGSFVGLDGALITDGTSTTVLDNTAFTYTGTWNNLTAAGVGLYNNTQHRADAPLAGKTASWSFSGLPASCDTDGDGIPNSLDLDSDGDGCPDAIEGGAPFAVSNLVNTTIAGGNSGPNYNGTSTQPVTQNLCNSTACVGSTSATMGVPISAGTGQSIGTSQDKTQFDRYCNAIDTDGDGIPDIDDLDDDNDGILDTDEDNCNLIFENFGTGTPAAIPNANVLVTSTKASVTSTIGDGSVAWLSGHPDRTFGDNNGNMLIVYNVSNTKVVYTRTMTGLTIGRKYNYSAHITNILKTTWTPGNVTLRARDAANNIIGEVNTGAIPVGSINWRKYGFDLIAPTTSVTLEVIINATSTGNGIGEDFAIDDIAFGSCDLDGDGIPNSLDLDSDGDGCPDAIEGGASFIASNLVSSSMAGGNSGASYTGTSVAQVTQNLGNTVGSTTTTMGVPTIAGTGQTVGYSQNATTSGCLDTDGDGIPDLDDLDDDNDGILDTDEATCNTILEDFGSSTKAGPALPSTNVTISSTAASLYSTVPTHPGGAWIAGGADRTPGDVNGNMLFVYNLGTPLTVYTRTMSNLVVGASYNFSAFIASPLSSTAWVSPNVTLRVLDNTNKVLGEVNTGNIAPGAFVWRQYGVDITATTSSVKLEIISNIDGALYNNTGNDFALDDIAFGLCDTDGDGIPNSLDLDSDGDGCPDALEGGANFTTSNLVSSTLAGGTTNVKTNLGNTVGNTATTMGVPTLAGTGQTIGTSQSATVQDFACIVQPPFSCTIETGYLFQASPTDAYSVNLASTATTLVKSGVMTETTNRELNALGFNQTDNFIWGYRANTNQVVRIGSDFIAQPVSISGLPTTIGFNTGDVSATGVLYLYAMSTTTIYRVDVNPASPTYLKLLPNLTTSAMSIADWAFSPIDGNLYGLSGTLQLYRVNPTTGAATVVGIVSGGGIAADNFGAVYMDNTGALYASANTSGRIYKLASPHTNGLTATLVGTGPASGLNDGARCPQAPVSPCPTVAPALSTTTKTNTCPATTIDLSTITASNTPTGTIMTWHTSATATAANRITSVTAVTSGTYYAAFFHTTNNCYSGTAVTPVTATTVLCCASPSVGGTAVYTGGVVCDPTNTGTITVAGKTGTVVKWQTSINGGANWTDITSTSALNTYTFTNAINGQQYRAVVNNGGSCGDATSTLVTITTSVSVCPCATPSVGGTAAFAGGVVCSPTNTGTVTLSGQTGTVVKWQTSINGGTIWTDIASTSALTSYSFTNAANGQQYRAVVNSGGTCLNANSTSVAITSSTAVCPCATPSVGGVTSFTGNPLCSVSNAGTVTLSGQTGAVVNWQTSINGGRAGQTLPVRRARRATVLQTRPTTSNSGRW